MSARNMSLLSRTSLGSEATGGEGLAIHLGPGGKRTLFAAGAFAPLDFVAIDVTDPRRPEPIYSCDLPHRDVRSNNLSISGDLMTFTRQPLKPGVEPAGLEVFDISDPSAPRSIGFFSTAGPGSMGTHFVWFVDGRYAFTTSCASDAKPRHWKDMYSPMILDLVDPTQPVEVGRWSLPGVYEGDEAPPPLRPAELHARALGIEPPPSEALHRMSAKVGDTTIWDFGYRSHNISVYPERPDRAYVAYVSGGVVILDISDLSAPQLVGRLQYSPPLPGYTHTVVPLGQSGYLAVSDESVVDAGEDWPKPLWFADARYEERPVMLSTAPLPMEKKSLPNARFGAHNLHENNPVDGSFRSDEIVIGTFYSEGVRAYDVSDPFFPREVAYFVPEVAGSPAGCAQINDVYVDERAVVYAPDRVTGELFVLQLECV